jgi:hypothetical protein
MSSDRIHPLLLEHNSDLLLDIEAEFHTYFLIPGAIYVA